jgi:hypothetical protein
MDFFPTAERGVGGDILPFYLCLYLNQCVILFFMFANEIFHGVMKYIKNVQKS